MNDTPYIFRDPDYRPERANHYVLLLQLFPETFSFAVGEQGRLLAFGKNLPLSAVAKPDSNRDIFTADYLKTVIGLPASSFTLIPKPLFKLNGVIDIARYLDVKSNEAVLTQQLDEENEIIYKTSGELLKIVDTRFNLRATAFGQKGWIRFIANNHPDNHTLYLDIRKDTVHILNFKGHKIRFFNSFEFANHDELVYFVSFVVKELQLTNEEIKLVVSGDFENSFDNRIARLSQFFNQVEVNELTPELKIPSHLVGHELLSLTALSLCA